MRQVDAKYNQRHLKAMRLEVKGNSRKGEQDIYRNVLPNSEYKSTIG